MGGRTTWLGHTTKHDAWRRSTHPATHGFFGTGIELKKLPRIYLVTTVPEERAGE